MQTSRERARPAWDLIVVGGGMCGVALAHEVERCLGLGARVLLLEASARLGGRARTRSTPEGHAIDVGAHYFGVKHRRVRALAERLCKDDIFERSAVYGPDPASRGRFGGTFRVTPRSRTFFDVQGLERDGPLADRLAIMHSMSAHLALEALVDVHAPWRTPFARRLDRMTFADWIERQNIPPWIAEMWGLGSMGIMSVPAKDISLLYWLWYHASNGGLLYTSSDYAGGAQEFALRRGMGGLVHALARELTRTEVRLNAPVVAVEHGHAGCVTIELADGQRETARTVVIATTPHASRKVAFEPALDPRRARLMSQRTGHSAKAVLSYARPHWHDSHGQHIMSYAAGPDAHALEWGLDTSDPATGHYSLMFFVSPRLFERLGPNADDATIERAIVEAAVEMTGEPWAAHPTRVDVEIWARDPWVGGGPNTVMGPGVLSQLEGVLGEPEGAEGRLHFASAEQSFEFTGYLEGALAAAERAASAVLSVLEIRDGIRKAQKARYRAAARRGIAPVQASLAAAALAALTPAVRLSASLARFAG
jgi:monoamine oxidase